MVAQIFMSHTKADVEICNKFDVIAARVGLKVFRSELENIPPPAWTTIKQQLHRSAAMFLLVGSSLVRLQELAHTDKEFGAQWSHTQNWIAYEIGLACAKYMDVWVFCDKVEINFPVPYFNNYSVHGLDLSDKNSVEWMKIVLSTYSRGSRFLVTNGSPQIRVCRYCGIKFNFYTHQKGIICPSCLKFI